MWFAIGAAIFFMLAFRFFLSRMSPFRLGNIISYLHHGTLTSFETDYATGDFTICTKGREGCPLADFSYTFMGNRLRKYPERITACIIYPNGRKCCGVITDEDDLSELLDVLDDLLEKNGFDSLEPIYVDVDQPL